MASAVIDLSRADEPAVAPPSGQIDLSGADEPAPRRPSNVAIDLTDESSSVDKTRGSETFALVPRLAGTRPIIRLPASGEVTVGRSAEVQIQLNYAFISRRHARLIVEAGRAYVVPLCRDNLVTVNGEPVARGARVELRFGDAVSFVKEEADFAYRVERRAPPPANEGQTASGTKRPRTASDGDVEADYECCICSGVIAACHCLPCGHAACGECLVRWLATKRECPECRAAVPPLAVLAPVHIVDNAIEARIGAVRAAEREDWEARRSRWRRTRPDGPLRAPPSPAERGPRPRAPPPRASTAAPPRARRRRNAIPPVADIRALLAGRRRAAAVTDLTEPEIISIDD